MPPSSPFSLLPLLDPAHHLPPSPQNPPLGHHLSPVTISCRPSTPLLPLVVPPLTHIHHLPSSPPWLSTPSSHSSFSMPSASPFLKAHHHSHHHHPLHTIVPTTTTTSLPSSHTLAIIPLTTIVPPYLVITPSPSPPPPPLPSHYHTHVPSFPPPPSSHPTITPSPHPSIIIGHLCHHRPSQSTPPPSLPLDRR